MFEKFSEIADAWIKSYNPTEQQKKLAEERFKICDTCEHKKVLTDKITLATICGECGCPIAKKVFSSVQNACPLKKWKDVDEIFLPQTHKKSKTLM